jgi:hypothetical protein
MADAHDDLVRDLLVLGRSVPQEPASLAPAVMARLAAAPAPRRTPLSLLGSGRRRVAVVVVALVLGLLAAPPVRAALAEWFGFKGVLVERGEPAPGVPADPPSVTGDLSPTDAAGRVDFDLWVPARLGEPEGVEVSADERVVSMSWTDPRLGRLRLDQFSGEYDWTFAKRSPHVRYVSVADRDAIWFDVPHDVVMLGEDNVPRTSSARLAGHTLIWFVGDTTLRLEGDLTATQATRVAESISPVP